MEYLKGRSYSIRTVTGGVAIYTFNGKEFIKQGSGYGVLYPEYLTPYHEVTLI